MSARSMASEGSLRLPWLGSRNHWLVMKTIIHMENMVNEPWVMVIKYGLILVIIHFC
jgi:hypothetical protein